MRRDGVAAILRRVDGARRRTCRRPAAERDRTLKQIIPYLVLRDGDRIFLMKRTRAGGDARLHDHYTIGVGGHLNPGDGSVTGRPRAGVARGARSRFHARTSSSWVCSTTTPWTSGVHHLGLVYVARRGRSAGRGARDAQAERLVRADRGRARRLRPDGDVEPARARRDRRARLPIRRRAVAALAAAGTRPVNRSLDRRVTRMSDPPGPPARAWHVRKGSLSELRSGPRARGAARYAGSGHRHRLRGRSGRRALDGIPARRLPARRRRRGPGRGPGGVCAGLERLGAPS